MRGIICNAYLEEAYRRIAKKNGNLLSKWKEWEVTVQMGVTRILQTLFFILNTSSTLVFTYFRHKSVVTNLFPQIPQRAFFECICHCLALKI